MSQQKCRASLEMIWPPIQFDSDGVAHPPSVADVTSTAFRSHAFQLAENVYLLETLKMLAKRDEVAAAMLANFMEMRAELRKGEVE